VSHPPDDLPITEQANLATAGLDQLSTEDMLALIHAQDAEVAEAVRPALPEIARAVDLVAGRLSSGGRLFYAGAGTSGRIGLLDAAEWRPTFGTVPEMVRAIIAGGTMASVEAAADVEDDEQAGAMDLRDAGVSSGDVVVGITASGGTPYVLGALRAAREAGAATISIACNPVAPVAALSDIAIVAVTGPEVIAGSTRMKAGTAQKMILNMLSTAVNVKLGKVFGNLMVDIQPLNQKLIERARRIVAEATGVPDADAAALLDAAGGNVKAAIVMAVTGVDFPEAQRRLERAGGFVRTAIEGQD
jgi:N-acetylmuramic acid 6-phosphate etherase